MVNNENQIIKRKMSSAHRSAHRCSILYLMSNFFIFI